MKLIKKQTKRGKLASSVKVRPATPVSALNLTLASPVRATASSTPVCDSHNPVWPQPRPVRLIDSTEDIYQDH